MRFKTYTDRLGNGAFKLIGARAGVDWRTIRDAARGLPVVKWPTAVKIADATAGAVRALELVEPNARRRRRHERAR